jgi:hypothetical protein
METNKIWFKWLIIGIAAGIILSSLNFYLNNLCINSQKLCSISKITEFLSYFPTIYLFLYNAVGFISENILISIMFFIVPILQYSMIGSITGLIIKNIKEKEKRRA